MRKSPLFAQLVELWGLAIGFSVGAALTLCEVKVLFSPDPGILAFACAVGTGLLFGFLPARKASQLESCSRIEFCNKSILSRKI